MDKESEINLSGYNNPFKRLTSLNKYSLKYRELNPFTYMFKKYDYLSIIQYMLPQLFIYI